MNRNRSTPKLLRFIWRSGRNLLCLIPITRRVLFPQRKLAKQFGRGDAQYAWDVFLRHFERLRKCGFAGAKNVLEIGPGQNLGTGLLWWVLGTERFGTEGRVVCWDVFNNANVEKERYWATLAQELLTVMPRVPAAGEEMTKVLARLRNVADGVTEPRISYRVEPLEDLERNVRSGGYLFDLVYSQAAIEHIWAITEFWESVARMTEAGGWHSHRIDLADHGRRSTNYVEMLEWADWSYFATMRYIPGAVNRWRAGQHLEMLTALGFVGLSIERESQPSLPVRRGRLARPFRDMDEEELKTTAIDVVARLAQ